MSPQTEQISSEREADIEEKRSPSPSVKQVIDDDPDAEFDGYEERRKLERKLLWKLDLRMFILVIVYILNYVCDRCICSRFWKRTINCQMHLRFQIDRNNAACVCALRVLTVP